MDTSRRDFLKLSGLAAGAALVPATKAAGTRDGPAPPLSKEIDHTTTSICPYCAVGCGMIVGVADGKVVNIEGDPESPINQGALCSKGSTLSQLVNSPERITKPAYRAPGATEWQEVEWDWALDQIAQRIKKTRDANWVETDEQGRTVRRTEAIASIGSAALDNEECSLLAKALRSLGLVYIEHQARLCHSSTVAALAESFGRGAMTNHWIDLRNSDVILIMGANPAENHPISFRWVMAAKDRGAIVIHVDPRFTRTSANATIYAPLRSGTDIAFLGGMINYILDNELYDEEYVREYTNASYLVHPEYSFEAGMFSGFQPEKGSYDKGTWWYQMGEDGIQLMDRTLQDPQCVFQLLKQHYARYDLDTVSNITGTPKADLLRVYAAMGTTGRPDRVASVMYAMGWTQHTHGTQNIRAAAIVQLLLGNMGKAGGGINAMRGESNVQGSTDHGLLFHILPGYLAAPRAKFQTLAEYIDANTPKCSDPLSANWWQNFNKYAVSLLKFMYGDNATPDNDFGYGWLPKLADGANYSWLAYWPAMRNGVIKGFIAWGQNPAVSGTDATGVREALEHLEWMVAVNLWDTETSSFWRRPGVDPTTIQTEVFNLPCAASVEKEGSITNSGRWAQWRYKAAEPLGEAKADAWIINQLMVRLRKLYAEDPGPNPDPILKLLWNYGEGEVDAHQVAKQINGWAVTDVKDKDGNVIVPAGQQVKNFTQLQADGSTACGCWIYSGSYNEDGNMMARRDNQDTHFQGLGLFSNWAWAWPMNRRILYNRASVNMAGEPFDPKRVVIRWNAAEKKWEGDVPDGGWAPGERLPFIMRRGGRARIFGPTMADGPFPEHYEPWESPVMNPLHLQDTNPALWDLEKDAKGATYAFPLVATTFRVTEHWQTGAMTRNLPWLAEMQPDMFVEISPELAVERGIVNGERVLVQSARGSIEAVALVTRRLRPFVLQGQVIHEVAMPWHWGYMGVVTGDSANELTPPVGDANTMIPETKAFLCNISKLSAEAGAVSTGRTNGNGRKEV